MKISILIPCYNEEKSIGHVLKQIQQIKLPVESEIIVVDDGSTDNSPHIIEQVQNVKLIQHKVNRGKGVAIKTGVEQALGDLIVIQDADLEYNPANIPDLVTPLLKGEADMVLGSRFKGKMEGMSRSHSIANRALSFTASGFLGKSITDIMTGYKAFTKKGFQGINLSSKSFEVEVELVAQFASKGLKIIEIPIDYKRRPYGKAKINWKHGFKSLPAFLRHSRTENSYSLMLLLSCFFYYLIFNIHNTFFGFRGRIGEQLLNGDEPHYIIIVQSIIQDFDLRIENNYMQASWSPDSWHAVQTVNGYYSAHGIGLSLLLTPFYYLGGVFLCQLFLSVLSALVVMYIYKTCLKSTVDHRSSLVTATIFGFASLIVPFSNQIFPEIPMALILLAVIYYGVLKNVNKPPVLFSLGLLVGFSPFLKISYTLFVLIFIIYLVTTCALRKKSIHELAIYLCPVIVLGLLMMVYQQIAFGDPFTTPQLFKEGNILQGFFGLMFDRYYGLLIYFPAIIIAFFGISIYFLKLKKIFFITSASFLSYYLLVSLWSSWHGGWALPARLILSTIPLSAIPMTFAIQHYHGKIFFKIIFTVTTFLSFLINFSLSAIRGLGLGTGPSKTKIFNALFTFSQRYLYFDLGKLMPSFNLPLSFISWLWMATIISIFLIITLFTYRGIRSG